jgi:iron-sulfur cluster assembly protein
MDQPLLSLTPRAVARIRHLLETRGEGALGLKLGVRPTGCSGLTYSLGFAREVGGLDRVIEADGIRLVVDAGAVPILTGTEMDFVEDKLGASFVFNNPNEKSRCGCGESFGV